jgi:hypothetical protein
MFVAKHVFILAVVGLGLIQAAQVRASEELYRKVAPATAYISTSDGPLTAGSGTGFLIDAQERLLITARHVVETKNGVADAVVVVFAQTKDGEVVTEADYYRANWKQLAVRGKVVYDSVRRDMAVIQVEKLPEGIKPLELAPQKARPGQTIHVVGNSSVVLGGMFNYCRGQVRNTFRYNLTGANVLATHAPTNRGDSGGPVVNNLGEVVGFCSLSTGGARSKKDALDGDQLVDLSICVSEIRTGLQELRSHLVKSDKPNPPDAAKTITFKGVAQKSVHLAQLEKDVTYRIVVKAEGFTPEMRIDAPEDKTPNPLANSAQGVGKEVHMLFTATQTAEHRIVIGYAVGTDVQEGQFRYTLTIDRASFEAEKTVKEPQLLLNEHVRKFEAGKIYDIIVRGKGFEPDLRVLDGGKTVAMQFNNGVTANAGKGGLLESVGLAQPEYETTLRFVAPKTGEFRIHVIVSPFSAPGTVKRPYAMRVTEPKTELSVRDQLTGKDPLYPKGGPFKVHTVKLQAGKTYQIDLVTTAFDGRLLLENSDAKLVMQGFDADGFNSRLIFRPAKTDTYRVLASSHQLDASGAYALVVAESPNVPSAFVPGPGPKKELKDGK